MQGGGIDDEHPKTATSQNTEEVVFVSDDALAKRERKFGFDGEYLG